MTVITGWISNFAPLRNARTRTYISGQAVSMIGIWLQQTAMALLVYQLSGGQAFALGVSALCASLPVLLLGMFTGALADRYDRRKLLIGCHAVEIALTFAIAPMIQAQAVQLVHLYAFAFLMGCVNSLALLPAVALGDPRRTGLLLAAAASGSLVYAFFFSPVISHIRRMRLTLSLTLGVKSRPSTAPPRRNVIKRTFESFCPSALATLHARTKLVSADVRRFKDYLGPAGCTVAAYAASVSARAIQTGLPIGMT